ncbi:guanylyl cyclase, partial [Aphelenchoides avenae]
MDSVNSNAHFTVYALGGERVIGVVHATTVRLNERDMRELRAMRLFDASNINRFIGVSVDGPQVISVWRYCHRGTLGDVNMANNALSMDGFFIYSLVRDVCEGLCYLHASVLGWHGNMRSTNCLINDRWQVKLSEFGLKSFREHEKREAKDMLWTAPENIREGNAVGSKLGDIFSFSIVCSELVNMKPAWENADDTKGNPEGATFWLIKYHLVHSEIVYRLKKGGRQPLRPKLEPVTTDLSPAF